MRFGLLYKMTVALLALVVCVPAMAQETLTVYAGRSKSLVEPLVEQFRKETGVQVQVRYAGTTQLALALVQEGDRSPADVFWAQDTGALELLTTKNLFTTLPDELTSQILPNFRSEKNTWAATSARGRTLAYAPARIAKENLPASVFDLTDPKYKGRIGWAPTNASFQAFVTGMRSQHGEEKTRQWLKDMIANQPKAYPRNAPILDGIAAGEIDLGLLNHYYLRRILAQRSDYPVQQTTFANQGDIGNLLFVAGAGVLKTSKKQELAQRFIRFLLNNESQTFFTTNVYEYPVVPGMEKANTNSDVTDAAKAAPKLPYSSLSDLDGTLKMMRELGLL